MAKIAEENSLGTSQERHFRPETNFFIPEVLITHTHTHKNSWKAIEQFVLRQMKRKHGIQEPQSARVHVRYTRDKHTTTDKRLQD